MKKNDDDGDMVVGIDHGTEPSTTAILHRAPDGTLTDTRVVDARVARAGSRVGKSRPKKPLRPAHMPITRHNQPHPSGRNRRWRRELARMMAEVDAVPARVKHEGRWTRKLAKRGQGRVPLDRSGAHAVEHFLRVQDAKRQGTAVPDMPQRSHVRVGQHRVPVQMPDIPVGTKF